MSRAFISIKQLLCCWFGPGSLETGAVKLHLLSLTTRYLVHIVIQASVLVLAGEPKLPNYTCIGYLGYPFQNKQRKSCVENLARYVDKEEKVGVVVIINALLWNGYPKRYDAKRQTGEWYVAYLK